MFAMGVSILARNTIEVVEARLAKLETLPRLKAADCKAIPFIIWWVSGLRVRRRGPLR